MGALKDWVVGLFANKYIKTVASPVTKTVEVLSGYKTYLTAGGGALTSLAAVVTHAQALLADGFQYSDVQQLTVSPEYATLVICLGILFNRVGTKKLESKLTETTPPK